MRNLFASYGALVVVLCASTSTAFALAPPTLGTKTGTSTPVLTTRGGNQRLAVTACDAARCVEVWAEDNGGASTLMAAVIDPATSDQVAPIPISDVSQVPGDPSHSVAYDGTRFAIIWLRGEGAEQRAYLRFYTLSGDTLTPASAEIEVGSSLQFKSTVGIAAGGGQTLAIWRQSVGANLNQVFAQVYSGAGTEVGTAKQLSNHVVGMNQLSTTDFRAAYHSSAFGVAWQQNTAAIGEQKRVDFRLVNFDGSLGTLQSGVVPAPMSEPYPANVTLAANATGFLVAWQEGESSISGLALDSNGVPSGTAGVIVSANFVDVLGVAFPRLATVNDTFFLVWQAFDATTSTNHLRGSNVTIGPIAATVTDGTRFTDEESDFAPLITTWGAIVTPFGTDASVVFSISDAASGLTKAYARFVDPTALASAPSTILGVGPSAQRLAAVASNGQKFLVVWQDNRDNATSGLDIWGAFYDLDGAMLGSPFTIEATIGDQFNAAVAAIAGGRFLVSWVSDRNPSFRAATVFSRTVSTAGALGSVVKVSSSFNDWAELSPSVAASGDQFVIAWEDWQHALTSSPAEVRARRMTATGAVSGAVFDIATNAQTSNAGACAPSVAAVGTSFFVAYESPCSQTPFTTAPHIYGRAIPATGALGGIEVVAASGSGYDRHPSVTSDGTSVYIAWTIEDAASSSASVLKVATRSGGTISTVTTVQSGAVSQALDAASVVFVAPNRLLTAWTDVGQNELSAYLTSTSFPAASAQDVFDVATGGAVVGLEAPLNDVVLNTSNAGAGVSAITRLTVPTSVAFAGQRGLLAMTYVETVDGVSVPRVSTRALTVILTAGDACSDDAQCATGHCSTGVCCEAACDGLCQACGASGKCDATPATDDRCNPGAPVLACSTLSTTCRTFVDATANRCIGFGQCVSPSSPLACTDYGNAADGTSCTAALCPSGGECMDGDCACGSSDINLPVGGLSPDRVLPPGGCAVGGDASGATFGTAAFILLALLSLRRRTLLSALLALLVLPACSDGGTIVEVELTLTDAVFKTTRAARIVLSPADTTMFPETMTAVEVKKGLSVINQDVDGDGKIDIVVEFAKEYPFKNSNKFALKPSGKSAAQLSVRGELYDDLGNRFADAQAPTPITPNATTKVVLEPACHSTNCAATRKPTVAATLDFGAERVITDVAIASLGQITAAVVGAEGFDPGGAPNQGQVTIYPRDPAAPQKLTATPAVTINGASVSDRFGHRVLVADLDNNGTDELIVSAPGARGAGLGERGAVYVLRMPAGGWPATATLSGADVAAIVGDSDGANLGEALAVADLDGNGTKELILGAPGHSGGIGAVYIAPASAFVFGSVDKTVTGLATATGTTSSRFGSALASLGDAVAVGAPGARSVHVLSSAAQTTHKIDGGMHGNFGATLQAFDFDHAGGLDLAVGASLDSAGTAYVFARDALTTTTTLAAVAAVIRGTAASNSLGTSFTVLPSADGDALVIGAPATQARPGVAAVGSTYLFRSQLLQRVPNISIDAAGAPASTTWSITDSIGRQLATGDFDGDGSVDILTSSANKLFFFFGPNL